jgi:hypothetical protein
MSAALTSVPFSGTGCARGETLAGSVEERVLCARALIRG